MCPVSIPLYYSLTQNAFLCRVSNLKHRSTIRKQQLQEHIHEIVTLITYRTGQIDERLGRRLVICARDSTKVSPAAYFWREERLLLQKCVFIMDFSPKNQVTAPLDKFPDTNFYRRLGIRVRDLTKARRTDTFPAERRVLHSKSVYLSS